MSDGYLDGKRADIVECDRELMDLLRKRLDLAMEIGKYKAEHGLPALDPEVERQVIERYRRLASERGMDPDVAERICRSIMDESVASEEAIISKR